MASDSAAQNPAGHDAQAALAAHDHDAVARAAPAAAPQSAAAAGGETEATEAPEPEATGSTTPASVSKPKDEPVQIGYKVFQTPEAALKYYYDLVKCLRREQDINEYEHKMVFDLLERGHPAAAQKIGCGVAAFQILKHGNSDSDCFFVIRNDGSREDFSIRKSVAGLFPLWGSSSESTRKTTQADRGRGRGRGRGARGSSSGGRGDRGGRGGGGRGFRARGRGRRGRGR
ncbi:hypothetical protein WJX84_010475 [Apatococcus fuscideae]|uniref:Uncharacterized protein n=1 Tax=Apatococcus fuscideae TaxID=2026836 RepID=A0AAW1TG93_9CHLO